MDSGRSSCFSYKGGTSTDVSRYDGKLDHIIESTIAGRKISTPMLNIATVAAGGGSMLFWRNGLLVVGPEASTSRKLLYACDSYLSFSFNI